MLQKFLQVGVLCIFLSLFHSQSVLASVEDFVMKDYIMAKNNIEENLRGGDNYSQAIDVFVESKINNPKDLQEILIRIERVIPSLGMSQTHRDFRYILEYLKQKIHLEFHTTHGVHGTYNFLIHPDNIGQSSILTINEYYEQLNTEEKRLFVGSFYQDENEMREAILLGYDTYSNVDEIEDITEYYLYLLYFKYYSSDFDVGFEFNSESTLTGSVKIDTNHQFAGKTLVFDIELIGFQKIPGKVVTVDSVTEEGDRVQVHYILKYEDGTKIEDSKVDFDEPLDFVVGDGQMIDGFDFGVRGMKIGEKKTLVILPQEAFGDYDKNAFEIIPKSELQLFVDAGYKLEVGEVLPTIYGEFVILEVYE